MANNLKDYGSFIPGYRPGKRTADYLEKVMIRITYVGAAFLAVVAIIPTIIYGGMNVDFELWPASTAAPSCSSSSAWRSTSCRRSTATW